MLAKFLSRDGGRVTARGHHVSDIIDVIAFYVGLLLVFAFAGSVESGRWF